MKLLIISVISIFFSSNVFAIKLARTSIESLYEEANQVATVKVISARATDNLCGITYAVKVLEPVKGVKRGDILNISDRYLPSTGLRTGQHFLIFTNQTYNQCLSTPENISHAGYGAFWIGSPPLIDFDIAIKVPKSFIQLPKTMKIESGIRGDEDTSEIDWVQKSELINYLKVLNDKKVID